MYSEADTMVASSGFVFTFQPTHALMLSVATSSMELPLPAFDSCPIFARFAMY